MAIKVNKIRVFFWALELVVLLAVVEHFLIRPRYRRLQGTPVSQSAVHGDLIPAWGDDARLPPGLQEVTPAYFPPYDFLLPTAKDFVKKQYDYGRLHQLPLEVVNSIGMHFRLVPPGEFVIGSPVTETGHSIVENAHVVEFTQGFYMGSCEVTQEQWETVMGKENNPSHFRGRNLPVEEVSWTQCVEFVRKLNDLELLPKDTYRLPTEAQWEYACRGGSSAAYCFGDNVAQLERFADYDANNYRRTAPVGQRLPNALGLYDMHGNVWEWCQDLYTNYPGDNSPQSLAHQSRCIRGGNWYVPAEDCRSASRSRLPDQSVGNMLGFRIIRILY